MRRARSIRWQLGALCLGLLLPTLLFVGVLLWQYAGSERSRAEAEARELSSDVAVALDREINSVLTTLQALATSPSLQTGDMAAFYAQVSEIHRLQDVHISLRDVGGHTILTTRAPFGASVVVPPLLAETDREIARTGAATVSNLFVSTTSGKPVFQIVAAPVRVAGEPTYLLAASIDLEYLVAAIRRLNLPPGWIGGLVDGNGIIAVRSEQQDQFSGRKASPDFFSHTVGQGGSYYGAGLDRREILLGYARSSSTPWTATASIASDIVAAPRLRSLLLLAGLGLALALLAGAFALPVARRVDRAMRRLSDAAEEIGQGRPLEPPVTSLTEVNQVGEVLATAARQLQERQHEREASAHEQKRLNEALAAQANELRESNEEIQRYAHIVSHDLRAPLVNIMGFASELQSTRTDIRDALAGHPRAEEIDRDVDEALGFIQAAVTKMESLVAAILRLAREGRRPMNPEPLVMPNLVQGLADAIRHQTEAAGSVIEIASDLPSLTADRLAIEQIFGNLLDNAVKYAARGRAGRISVTGTVRGDRIAYQVRDNGRGIALADQARAFELFRRVGVQDRAGEGIGLAHVKSVVRALGGRIDLASVLNAGTTFTITLPRSPVVVSAQPAGAEG